MDGLANVAPFTGFNDLISFKPVFRPFYGHPQEKLVLVVVTMRKVKLGSHPTFSPFHTPEWFPAYRTYNQ